MTLVAAPVTDVVEPAPQGVRALLWLKTREWLGESRDTSRLWLIGLLALGWFGLVISGAVFAGRIGRITPGVDLGYVAAGAWPLWAVIPLLGGGGGEVVAGHRLAAYPVAPSAVFGGAWLTALVDIPYLVVLPLVLGLATALAGMFGLIAAVAFTAGASAVGQLLSWTSFLILAGRKRSGLAALLLTGVVVGLLGALPLLIPNALDLSRAMPGGWLQSAGLAAANGSYAVWAALVVACAAPVALAVVVGPSLTRVALDREMRSTGVGSRPWGAPTWWVRGSELRALVVASLRGMGRALGAQVALAGVLAVPTLVRMPGIDFAQVSLVAMGGVAAIAAATVLGVNTFAFDAGGATALLSWPVRLRDVLLAKALTLGLGLFAAQVAVTALGAYVNSSSRAVVAEALVLCLARTLLVTGAAMVWSVWLPSPSDYDSLRARISTPYAIGTFCMMCAFLTYVVSQGAQTYGLPAVLLIASAGAVGCFAAALNGFQHPAGIERVASGVLG